ncbi:MAG: rRNA pseudouridine synthase [Cellulosilyticum sp.]|nr:rRNA pseudouridine synthase [Cellulosilyticum sp.]
MRLDKVLGHVGYGSRKEVQKMIKAKKVTVDGKCVAKSEVNVNPEVQEICVSGKPIDYKEFYYYLLHKPAGYVSATEDPRDETVIDLLAPMDRNKELFPVGRLDKDTEGLLVLTNNGKLAHDLLSPKKHVDKIYYAKVKGEMVPEDVEIFAQGMTLKDGTTYRPGKLEIISSGEYSEIYVTISEGKFHQVKKMVHYVGKEVIYLKRIQMGQLKLPETLELGEYRQLTNEELIELQKQV